MPRFNRKYSYFIIAFALVVCIISSATPHRSRAAASTTEKTVAQPSAAAQREGAREAYGNINLVFEENRGQSDQRVKFLSHAGNSTLFLTDEGAWFVLSKTEKAETNQLNEEVSPLQLPNRGLAMAEFGPRRPQREVKRSQYAVRMMIEGANRQAKVVGEHELEGKVNYFRGNDPSKWQTDVPTFAGVRYEGVYQGVDLVYYGNTQHELEYDFRVAPGADPSKVSIRFDGAEELKVDDAGNLLIKTPAGDLHQRKPLVYQEDGGIRREVASAYEVSSTGRVSFTLGDYDESRALVIDPALIYSTFLGGSSTDAAADIAVDAAGNAYVVGITTSDNFPATPGAFSTQSPSLSDVFITKLNASGSALVYSTFLGGNSNEDDDAHIAVDSAGNAYITGRTASSDFPTTPGAFDTTYNGSYDAFVTKLNASGSALVYSTFLGGSDVDFASGLTVDSAGSAYVCGITASVNFPTTRGAYDTTHSADYYDGFVTKLNASGSVLSYSTFFKPGVGIAVDSGGNAYITGTEFYVHQTTYVRKLNSTGSALIYSRLFGGSYGNQAFDIAVDAAGNVYVAGITSSPDFPTTPDALDMTYNGGYDAFLAKLDTTGLVLAYSTFLGGTRDEGSGSLIPSSTISIALDRAGNVYITSSTVSPDFPTTSGAFDTTYNDHGSRFNAGGDGFVVKVNMVGLSNPPTIVTSPLTIQQGRIISGATIATVSDDFSAESLAVYVIPGGTATGVTLSNLTNRGGIISADVIATCVATSGTVKLQVSDIDGLTDIRDLQVTVTPNDPPVIVCPANITVQAPTNRTNERVRVDYPNPTVTDDCSGVGTPSCSPRSGFNFPLGTTTVTCSVQDASRNTSNCSFTVTVTPPTGCTITCPANITHGTDPNTCSAVVNYPAPTTTGTCGAVTCTPASGSTFTKGTTTVNCSVAGGPSCSFTVTVNDTQNPTISCPPNQSASSPDGNSVLVSYPAPTVSDNCTGVGTPVCTPASGSNFPVGTTTVNCSVQDAAGNSANCSFTVTVTSCLFNCPANIVTGTTQGQCSAVVNYTTPTSSCGTVTCTPASGSTFQKGTTTVNCSVSGGSSCSFTVTVNDTQNPTITCPQNISAISSTGGSIPITYSAPTVSDNCSGVGMPVCSPASGSNFPVGTTTVNCSVQDAAGNSGNCSFTVTVTACTLNCPTNIITNASPGQCSAVATYTTPASTCGAVTCSPASGSTFQRGTTMVTCSVSGGPSCNFNITVIDAESPTISCPANQSATTTTSCAMVNYPAPTASDNCPGVNVVCSPPSGSCFSPGVTPVNCTAIDTSNNTAACAFTITVTAVTPPTFLVNLPGDDGDGVCDGTCTLRDAIIAANNSPGNDTIGFAPNLTTITLANEIVITNNGSLTINGLGASNLTIDGGPGTNRIFQAGSNVNLTVTDVTLTGGNGVGGGLNNYGGAILHNGGSLARLTLNRVHVTGNSASNPGGGVFCVDVPTVNISNSTFSNNTSGANGGGAAFQSTSVMIVNSTFSGNFASGNGGGMGLNGPTTLRNVTITNNNAASGGGGIFMTGSTVNLGSTIVAGNTGPNWPDVLGGITSVGYNLIGDTSNNTPVTYQSTDVLNRDPLLGPLQNNGGPTPTHAFTSGSSPAIDKGNSFSSTTDQRGFPRPVDAPNIGNAAGGDGTDIGAYEEPSNFQLLPPLVVNLPGDDGDGVCDGTCTLRDAITTANSRGLDNVIIFAPGLTNITLSNELIINNIGRSLSINGPGANVLTIDGGPGTNRIFTMDGGSGGLRVGNVTITGMTLTGGNGGGTIDNNKGGAVWARNASVILDGVNVTGNSASLSGGGVHFTGQVQGQPGTTVFYFIRNSTFSNNTTSGTGGGFNNEFSNVSITNSTFTGNMAGNGGGLAINSTFASVSTLRHLTITNNTVTSRGGGILSGTINMGNCIVAGNTANIQSSEIHTGSVTSVGFNLVGDSAGDAENTGTAIAYQSTDILDTPPVLGPLQNNGGTTPTRALLAGSPAIDKGNGFGSTTDQRGLNRPVDDPAIPNASGGDGADIGAFEVQSSAFIGRDVTHSSSILTELMDEQSFYKTRLLATERRTVSQLFAAYLPTANVYALSPITRYLFLTDSLFGNRHELAT